MSGGAVLPDGVVVVSPHLDDAVFSLGAALAHASRRGATVTILSVLAGDPAADVPPSAWDRRAGFASQAEAARARRAEDALACSILGVRGERLDFLDAGYAEPPAEAAVAAATVDVVRGASAMLVPGAPLLHDDHRWIARVALAAAPPGVRVGLYVEQPYAVRFGLHTDGRLPRPVPAAWETLRAGPRDRIAKLRACRAYRSQIRLFGRAMIWSVLGNELRAGGERIAWLDPEE